MKSRIILLSPFLFVFLSITISQNSFAEEEPDFENCNGFLSADEVKNVLEYDGEITQQAKGVTPVDDEPGLKTMCLSTFESESGTISMTIIVMDSPDSAIKLYEKNLNSITEQDLEVREYLTFWNNFDIVLNDQGIGSFVVSHYDKFVLLLHTSFSEDKQAIADVEQIGVLSTIVQKKILDLPDVSISPPNPVPYDDVGTTTDEPPPEPGPAPIQVGKFLSPLKQVAQGVEPQEVTCNEGLVLIFKYTGSPACVKPETGIILQERDWGEMAPSSMINSFEECAAAGNPVMESYPRQCRTQDGKHFVEILSDKEQCEIAGGEWGIWGNIVNATESCNPSTSDAGMECTDSSQCQSFCQANEGAEIGSKETGMCYGYELAICMQEIRDGTVDPQWCQ